MAIDVFNEERNEAAFSLANIREHKAHWGRALVRTDLSESDLDFLTRAWFSSVARERAAVIRYRDACGVLNAFSRFH